MVKPDTEKRNTFSAKKYIKVVAKNPLEIPEHYGQNNSCKFEGNKICLQQILSTISNQPLISKSQAVMIERYLKLQK